MPDWFLLALAILACFRLARLAALDEGPAGAFLRLRAAAGGYNLGPNGQPRTNLGRGITCPHCWGVWLALILALLLFPANWLLPLYWLAIAGGQSFLQELSYGR